MTYLLRLYVTGRTPSALRAISNLRDICATDLHGDAEVDVVDVLTRPDLAERDHVVATPTLIKRAPEPGCRIIGDLSDRDSAVLGISADGDSPHGDGPFRFEGIDE